MTVNKADSLALVDIYNNLDGDNWYFWTGFHFWFRGYWVVGWGGIGINNHRVDSVDLSWAYLKGTIPSSIGDLTELKYLDLQSLKDSVYGGMPNEMGNLTKLEHLALNIRTEMNIPSYICTFNNLEVLKLGSNFTGNIPTELGNLVKLQKLYLSGNNLESNIPSELGNLTNLDILYLSSNNLEGNIPPELGNLNRLSWLMLNDNNIGGTIPPELGNLDSLSWFNLYNNNLEGTIPPELGNLSKLDRLNLHDNNLSGAIPPELGNLASMTKLYLHNNNLEGTIPSQLGNLANLNYLYLNNNNLESPIPAELGNLSKLQNVYVNDNKFNFTDLEIFASKDLDKFEYAPQANIELTTSVNGATTILNMDAGGTQTTYQWYYDGTAISGATSAGCEVETGKELTKYLCKAKNTLLPDLVLNGKYVIPDEERCWETGALTFCLSSGKWEKASGNNKIKATDILSINDFLYFDGTITIDTSALEIDANGEFYVDNIPLPGGNTGKYSLAVGNYNLKLLGENGQITNFLNSNLEQSAELFGIGLKIDMLTLVNEKDKTGLSIGCSMKVPGILGGCGTVEKKETEIKLSDLEITSAGITLGGVAVKDMGLLADGFCLKNLELSYNSKKNILNAGMMLGLPFGDVGGGFKIEEGLVDSIGWHIESNVAPFVIGTTTVGIKGFFGHVSSITKPAMEVELGGIFSDILSDDLYRCTLSGTMVWPATIGFKGTGQFMRPIDNSLPFQLQGNTSVAWDVPNSVFKIELGGKFGTLDEKTWLMTGQGNFNIYFKETPSVLSGKMNGTMTLPKLSDNAPFNWLNSMFDFPVNVSASDRFIYGNSKVAYGEATFKSDSHGPYTLKYVIDLTKDIDDEEYLYFKISSGKTKSAIISEKSASTNATITKTFDVPENTELGIIEIKSTIEAPVSTLTSPLGISYTETLSNDSIIYTSSTDNKEAFWTLIDATPGTWTINLENPNTEDTIITYFQLKEQEFKFSVNQNGDEVTVTWNTEEIDEGQQVCVLLDNDKADFNGFKIKEADAGLGTLNFTLDENTPDCSYYVYVQLIDEFTVNEKYADEPVYNSLASLSPPDKFSASYNTQTDEVEFSWEQASSSDVAGYILTITDEYGNDSVYAVLNSVQTNISLYIEDHENKTGKIESYNNDGKIGCPSELSSLVTSAESIPKNNKPDNKLNVYPNPTTGKCTVRYYVSTPTNCEIMLFDINGRKIKHQLSGFQTEGYHQFELDYNDLPNGIYIIKYVSNLESFSVKSVLNK
ncbi:leucine-rich repeat domain-containing protein [Maribellus comscasis]|uniref:leucine-rich repeat domain-containing protein n=1 Tax=Maribellus comscasis TaxID=2681766 RepID=UPI00131D3B8F|nr:T9SS type A sorting domain-containing protein [Maribellus comscasis]